MPRRTAMIYPGISYDPEGSAGSNVGHPAHRGFAESIDADEVVLDVNRLPPPLGHLFLGRLPFGVAAWVPRYETYVTEFALSLCAVPRIKRRHPDATVIHLAAHHIMGRANYDDSNPRSWKDVAWAIDHYVEEKTLDWILGTYVDGVIAVSEYIRDGVRRVVDEDVPVEIVNPYVQPETMERLWTVEPDLDAAVALTVCDGREHKGMDLMVDGWPAVRREHPSAEYWIVGENHPAAYDRVPGVRTFGWVDDLAEVMGRASLFVHPARNDGCPVGVLEALAAGLPAVVTTTSGSGSIVGGVDERLVARPASDSLAERVADYFHRPPDDRRSLSAASSEVGRTFTEENQTAAFRRAVESILAERSGPRGPRREPGRVDEPRSIRRSERD